MFGIFGGSANEEEKVNIYQRKGKTVMAIDGSLPEGKQVPVNLTHLLKDINTEELIAAAPTTALTGLHSEKGSKKILDELKSRALTGDPLARAHVVDYQEKMEGLKEKLKSGGKHALVKTPDGQKKVVDLSGETSDGAGDSPDYKKAKEVDDAGRNMDGTSKRIKDNNPVVLVLKMTPPPDHLISKKLVTTAQDKDYNTFTKEWRTTLMEQVESAARSNGPNPKVEAHYMEQFMIKMMKSTRSLSKFGAAAYVLNDYVHHHNYVHSGFDRDSETSLREVLDYYNELRRKLVKEKEKALAPKIELMGSERDHLFATHMY